MQHFYVRNLEELQNYKYRRPDWIKLRGSVVGGCKFGSLPDASKAHLVHIWLLANRNENSLPNDAEWISTRVNATEKVDLDILAKHGFIELIK